MLYNYSYADRKRDLSNVLETVIHEEPRFISNFRMAPDAISAKHEYLEDNLVARGFVAAVSSGGKLRVTGAAVNRLNIGTLIRPANDSALFEIKDIVGNEIAVELVCRNGSEMSTASELKQEDTQFHFVSPQWAMIMKSTKVSEVLSGMPPRFSVKKSCLAALY